MQPLSSIVSSYLEVSFNFRIMYVSKRNKNCFTSKILSVMEALQRKGFVWPSVVYWLYSMRVILMGCPVAKQTDNKDLDLSKENWMEVLYVSTLPSLSLIKAFDLQWGKKRERETSVIMQKLFPLYRALNYEQYNAWSGQISSAHCSSKIK